MVDSDNQIVTTVRLYWKAIGKQNGHLAESGYFAKFNASLESNMGKLRCSTIGPLRLTITTKDLAA